MRFVRSVPVWCGALPDWRGNCVGHVLSVVECVHSRSSALNIHTRTLDQHCKCQSNWIQSKLVYSPKHCSRPQPTNWPTPTINLMLALWLKLLIKVCVCSQCAQQGRREWPSLGRGIWLNILPVLWPFSGYSFCLLILLVLLGGLKNCVIPCSNSDLPNSTGNPTFWCLQLFKKFPWFLVLWTMIECVFGCMIMMMQRVEWWQPYWQPAIPQDVSTFDHYSSPFLF